MTWQGVGKDSSQVTVGVVVTGIDVSITGNNRTFLAVTTNQFDNFQVRNLAPGDYWKSVGQLDMFGLRS